MSNLKLHCAIEWFSDALSILVPVLMLIHCSFVMRENRVPHYQRLLQKHDGKRQWWKVSGCNFYPLVRSIAGLCRSLTSPSCKKNTRVVSFPVRQLPQLNQQRAPSSNPRRQPARSRCRSSGYSSRSLFISQLHYRLSRHPR